VVKITYEGIGFGLLANKVPLAQLTKELVEEETMRFLRRLFGQEQLRRPGTPASAPPAPGNGARRPVSPSAGYEFVRV
jgi:hypothetical protein